MKDPDFQINQLLSKIQNLENKNEQMRKKIKEKEKELKNFGNSDKIKPETKKIIPKEKKITAEDDRKVSLRFQNEIKFLKNNSLQIKDNLVEQVIEFVPPGDFGIMYIMGDFNGWEPEIMKKDKDVFSYKVVLIKGFKYYYAFHSNEQTLIDYNNEYEENPVNLQEQNFIDLPQKKGEKTNYFDYKTDSNILKIAQRNYLLLNLDDDMDNILFLEIFQRHMLASKKQNDFSEEIKIKEAINLYYDDLIKKSDIYDKSKLENLQLYFVNRILLQNSPIMREVQYQYKILTISKDDNSFICMRLYDHNRIKLNSIYYADIENCWKIPFGEIVLKPISKRDKLYHLLSVKESKKIVEDFENDKENIIVAYFNDLTDLNKSSKSVKRRFGKATNLEELVKPIKVEPDDVELNDYEYYYLNNEIVKIKNKDDNSYIEYEIVEDKRKNKTKKDIFIDKKEEAKYKYDKYGKD